MGKTKLDEEPLDLQAGTGKRRRAAMAFFLGYYLYGKARVSDGEDEDRKGGDLLFGRELEQEGLYMSSGKKRRKLSCNQWTGEDMVERRILCRAPTKWKQLLRRIRAKLHFHHATSFHYDPLSYAMNFDDGCWQYCDSHVKVFCRSPSPLCSNGNLQDTHYRAYLFYALVAHENTSSENGGCY